MRCIARKCKLENKNKTYIITDDEPVLIALTQGFLKLTVRIS